MLLLTPMISASLALTTITTNTARLSFGLVAAGQRKKQRPGPLLHPGTTRAPGSRLREGSCRAVVKEEGSSHCARTIAEPSERCQRACGARRRCREPAAPFGPRRRSGRQRRGRNGALRAATTTIRAAFAPVTSSRMQRPASRRRDFITPIMARLAVTCRAPLRAPHAHHWHAHFAPPSRPCIGDATFVTASPGRIRVELGVGRTPAVAGSVAIRQRSAPARTSCYDLRAAERSHRGLVQRFAKPPSGVTCFEGSNPSLSATHRAVPQTAIALRHSQSVPQTAIALRHSQSSAADGDCSPPSRHSLACARSSVDRALGCGPKGRGFESRRARHRLTSSAAQAGVAGSSGSLTARPSALASPLPGALA